MTLPATAVPRAATRESDQALSGPWLTVAGVAESEGVSPRTVLRWIAQGHLQSRRQPGGRLRIHLDWYRAMIEHGRDDQRILGPPDKGG
jgi:excisionase family DNA binding protein